MRIIEIIKLSMEYNELLVNHLKGKLWLDNPQISQARKLSFQPKWDELLKEIDNILKTFKGLGIVLSDDEITQGIELTEKRKDVEIYLENHYKLNPFEKPGQETIYNQMEREGMRL